MSLLCLFIGGPADGEQVETNGSEIHAIAIRRREFVGTLEGLEARPEDMHPQVVYRRRDIRFAGMVFQFYAPAGMRDDDAIMMLLQNYAPAGPRRTLENASFRGVLEIAESVDGDSLRDEVLRVMHRDGRVDVTVILHDKGP